jgi:hypothetical protein
MADSLVLLWQHDVHALVVEPQHHWLAAQLQGVTPTQHRRRPNQQTGTCMVAQSKTSAGAGVRDRAMACMLLGSINTVLCQEHG